MEGAPGGNCNGVRQLEQLTSNIMTGWLAQREVKRWCFAMGEDGGRNELCSNQNLREEKQKGADRD